MIPPAGQLNTPCILQLPQVVGRDAAGREQIEYVDVSGPIWVRLRQPKSGDETEHDSQTTRTVWDVTAHFRDDIHADSRLVSGNRVFHVEGEPLDPHGDRRELKMTFIEEPNTVREQV